MNRTWEPVLCEHFQGMIWRIEADETSGVIGIETRDAQTRKPRFSAFNLNSGACYFKEIEINADSWFSLDKVTEGMLLIHGYVSENTPDHKGIIAIDISGNICWQQFNVALSAVTMQGLLVYDPRILPKKFSLLSAQTGKILNIDSSVLKPIDQPILFPSVLPDRASFPYPLPANLAGEIVFFRHKTFSLWSFHTWEEGSFSQHLLVEEGDGIFIRDFLSTGIQKLNPEAFFLFGDTLIYIRNKVEFVSYLL